MMADKTKWNKLFKLILHDSPVRITSAAIAAGISRHLREDWKSDRTVSAALVQKWRLVGERSFAPTDQSVIESLVATLDEFGVFPSDEKTNEQRTKLFTLLDFEPRFNVNHIAIQSARSATEAFLAVQAKSRDAARLTPSTISLALSCLVSQQDYLEDYRKLLMDTSGGRLIVFLLWDPNSDELAQSHRNSLFDELTHHGVIDGFNRAPSQLAIRVEFGVLETGESQKPSEPTELDTIQARLTTECRHITVRHRKWPLRLWSAHDVWVHLHNDSTVRAWTFIRHPDLFKLLANSAASTFVSPLDGTTLRHFLSALEIHWVSAKGAWVMPSAEPKAETSDDEERN